MSSNHHVLTPTRMVMAGQLGHRHDQLQLQAQLDGNQLDLLPQLGLVEAVDGQPSQNVICKAGTRTLASLLDQGAELRVRMTWWVW